MAKKFVRGITDVKTINNQDFDTNNVNDLLSDGQYNYIHRKKGKNEEYHNLTDNIKTISSDNTDLLTVTNNNKTTNTATLSPKHDAQKEQLLESTRNTVTIHHGANDSNETTKIDVNTHKVLTHNNLVSSSPLLTVEHQDGQDTTTINATKLEEKLAAEHYYICKEDVSGSMTLTTLPTEIPLNDNSTIKAELDYSINVTFTNDAQKALYSYDLHHTDTLNGEYGVYTDSYTASLFSNNYAPFGDVPFDVNSENLGLKVRYTGERITVSRDKEKITTGKVYNVSGKMLLVEKRVNPL